MELIMSPEDESVQNLNVQDPNLDMDDSDVSLDDIDTNNLVTAKTFAQHEENLRQQQRLIEDMQKELAKSQEQLRREQKLIITAKKLQLRMDKNGKPCSQAEILLNNLDVKNVNKIHIQHFLQHKSQQQALQTRANNYQQLFQVEQKIQEELHIEQAVQDIVRLIKQDGRTALLIVQLLRRYQLERNHQLQQAKEQMQTQPEKEPQAEIQKPAQIVVIDDTPVSSPFIDKNGVEIQNEPVVKKNSKCNKRKSSGSRSIWSRPEAFEKQQTKSGEKSSVDMEEIFRSVIDATRENHDTNSGNHDESSGNDASSDLVPQLNGFHLVTSEDFSQHSDDKIQYSHPEEICTTAVFVHEENNSSCHVDCYSKPANGNSPERIQFSKQHQEFAATQQYDFSKNEDFEDLMDVLRDDQQGVSNSNSNNGKELLGYTPVELANFLAAECESDVHSNNGIFDMRDLRRMQGQYIHINNYPNSNFDQHQNFDVEPPSMENDALPIEPHQEQAIDDVLNGEMQEPNVEWFDNLFQSPMPDRQNGNFSNGTANVNVQRPMDTFV